VNVCIGSARQLEVNDMIDGGDIQPSGSDVRGDQDTVGGGSKPATYTYQKRLHWHRQDLFSLPVQVLQTLLLLKLRVERVHWHLQHLE